MDSQTNNAIVAVCMLALLVTLPPARAQDRVAVPPLAPHASVHVNESAEVGELMAKIDRMAGRGRWSDAARLVRSLAVEYPHKLIAVAPDRYVSVAARLHEIVAAWPNAGLAAYRQLEEDRAANALASISSGLDLTQTLLQLERFFCTRTGWQLADRAAQLAIEAGRLTLAVRIYQRFLTLHPDSSEHEGLASGRLAIVNGLRGRADEARSWLNRSLRREDAEATVSWFGQSIGLTEVVEQLLAPFQTGVAGPTDWKAGPVIGSDWPIFAGSAGRNGVAAAPLTEPVSLWRRLDLDRTAMRADPNDEQQVAFRRAASRGLLLSRFPVVASGRVFLQSDSVLEAFDIENGERLWHRLIGGVARSGTPGSGGARSWHSPTVAGGRLFAAVNDGNPDGEGDGPPTRANAMVCLNAATGMVIWRIDSALLGEPASEWSFDSSPLIQGDALLTTVRRRRSFGFEDCYLVGLDGHTGRLLFRTHLGGSSTGGFGYQRRTLSIAAVEGDTAIVDTALGSLAAVSIDTGRVRWLWTYPVADRNPRVSWSRPWQGEVKPWHANPVILDGGRVYCLPTESDALFVLDIETGTLEATIRRTQLSDVHTLVGLRDHRLYGIGDEVFCYDLNQSALIWSAALAVDEPVFGRASLTRDGIAVPTRVSWTHYGAAAGIRITYPWDVIDGEGGNLVVLPNRIVVAGQEHLAVYGPKADVLSAARQQVTDKPNDPLPSLKLAEVAFRAGERRLALDALSAAVAKCGGFVQPVDAALKRRLFDACLDFAGVLEGELADDESAGDAAIQLYRYASQCPPNTESHLIYRVRMADLLTHRQRPAEAVELFQQILTDRSLREAAYPTADGESILAGLMAERRIAVLIDRHGRDVFADADQAASRRLGLIQAETADADQVTRILIAYDAVVQAYPNSLAAPQAWLAKGEVLGRAGRPVEACQSLYQVLSRYSRLIDRPDLMRRIADCNTQAGRPEVAWQWLTKAAREYPSARVDVDGVSMGLLAYRRRLGDIQYRVEPTRPALVPPLVDRKRWKFDQPITILEPRLPDQPGTDWSMLLLYTQDSIRALDPVTGASRWPAPIRCPTLPRLLLATSERYVLATNHQVFAVQADSGQELWRYGIQPLQILDSGGDWESPTALRGLACDGTRLAVLRADGTAVLLDLASGATLWSRGAVGARPNTSGPIAIAEPWLAFAGTREGRPVCILLALATGEPVRRIDVGDSGRISHLFFALDGGLIVTTTRRIVAYDPQDGRQRWVHKTSRNIIDAMVQPDLDGLTFSDDGVHLEKIALIDGRTLWRTAPLGRHAPPARSLRLENGQLIVGTARSVFSVDPIDGRLLWEGAAPNQVDFDLHLMGDSHVISVDVADSGEGDDTVYFYNHGDASGLIPPRGGVMSLDGLKSVRTITLRDGALIAHDINGLHVWTNATDGKVGPTAQEVGPTTQSSGIDEGDSQ